MSMIASDSALLEKIGDAIVGMPRDVAFTTVLNALAIIVTNGMEHYHDANDIRMRADEALKEHFMKHYNVFG